MEDQEFVSELFFVPLQHGPLDALPPIIDSLYETYTVPRSIDVTATRKEFPETTAFMEALGLDYEEYRITSVSHCMGYVAFLGIATKTPLRPRRSPGRSNSRSPNSAQAT